MQMRREGSALWITDNGFYEPAPLRNSRRATVLRCLIILSALLAIAAAMWGASNA